MSIAQSIAARSLIWLTAVMMPMQVVAQTSCGCVTSESAYQDQGKTAGCCHRANEKEPGKLKHNCCRQLALGPSHSTGTKIHRGEVTRCDHPEVATGCRCTAASSAVLGSSQCGCGQSCRCGTKETPKPATPPTESNDSTQKVVNSTTSVASVVTACPTRSTQYRTSRSSEAVTVTALDRCISLCRFTL